MSDLISSDEAKDLLGVDDATLQNYINNGTIRAQRIDGALMLQREDVDNLGATNPTNDSDDGTIILSGDSEDLSIDLGEVVDDSAQTVVEHNPNSGGTDSLTFGDELEVVNFDDGGTQELSFDDSEVTQEGLSFTDSNTAINTDVDETVIGTATATDDFQTVDYGEEEAEVSQSTVRRSVRSQRVREEEVQVHWFWPTLLILTTLVIAFFIVPYLVMGLAQNANLRSTDPSEGTATGHGAKDSMWVGIASTFAGFSVEPDAETFRLTQAPDAEWKSISTADSNQPDIWRYKQYRGSDSSDKQQEKFVIDNIVYQDDPANPGVQVPTQAQAIDGESGSVLQSYSVKPNTDGENVNDPDAASNRQYQPVLNYGGN